MGRNKIVAKKGNTKGFTKDRQPTGEAKSRGKKKAKLLREIAKQLVTGDAFVKSNKIAESVGLYFEDKELTVEVMMLLRQIEKAIKKGDTQAYNAAMDRMVGKPVQSVEMNVLDLSQKLINPITVVRGKSKK